MLLGEVKKLENQDGILFEDAQDLCRFIRATYDNAQDDKNPTDESFKAAQYLAFLMAYRDLDHLTKSTDSNPIPVEHFLQPGVRSAMKALQFFSKKAGDHTNIIKKVDGYTDKFIGPEDGRRAFDYQLKKVEQYFKDRATEIEQKTPEPTNAEEHPDSISMDQYIP